MNINEIIMWISIICIAVTCLLIPIEMAMEMKKRKKLFDIYNRISNNQEKMIENTNKRIGFVLDYVIARRLDVKIVNKSDFPLPKYESKGASGFDIRAIIANKITINPGEQYNFDTGLYVEIPKGYELQIRGRSGLAFKHGISLLHGVGTIDSDYRGEIGICLVNHSNKPYIVKNGDRIAQGIIAPVYQAEWVEVGELSDSERGQAGYGSTGV